MHTFTETGVHHITVTSDDNPLVSGARITAPVLVRYVRREIRSVPESDRATLMSAFGAWRQREMIFNISSEKEHVVRTQSALDEFHCGTRVCNI